MTRKVIGCDLGGTNLRAGIVDPDSGQVSHLSSVPSLASMQPPGLRRLCAVLLQHRQVTPGWGSSAGLMTNNGKVVTAAFRTRNMR